VMNEPLIALLLPVHLPVVGALYHVSVPGPSPSGDGADWTAARPAVKLWHLPCPVTDGRSFGCDQYN
jgi:hypothetical protein